MTEISSECTSGSTSTPHGQVQETASADTGADMGEMFMNQMRSYQEERNESKEPDPIEIFKKMLREKSRL